MTAPSRQPVLCAFQDSEHGRHAVSAAAWLAAELRAPLEVIHVFDPDAQPALPRRGPLRDPLVRETVDQWTDARTQARLQGVLEEIARSSGHEDVETRVVEGFVVGALRDAAVDRRAQVLVCGTAARRGIRHVLQGSVAAALATNAPCPVLTVPVDAAVAEPGPVLVGDDGSTHAARAVQHASALARRLGRELVRVQADDADPVPELVAAARACRACAIATGTRGRGPVRVELLGSVSHGLLEAAGRPVLLVAASAGDVEARDLQPG